MFKVGDKVSVRVPLYLQMCDRNGEKLQPFAIGKILDIDENLNKFRIQFETDDNDSDWISGDNISLLSQ